MGICIGMAMWHVHVGRQVSKLLAILGGPGSYRTHRKLHALTRAHPFEDNSQRDSARIVRLLGTADGQTPG